MSRSEKTREHVLYDDELERSWSAASWLSGRRPRRAFLGVDIGAAFSVGSVDSDNDVEVGKDDKPKLS